MGWSFERANDGNYALEVVAGTETGDNTIKYNEQLHRTHGLEYHQTMIASLGGTHGAFFLNGVESNAEFEHEVIAPSGRLDKEALQSKHPGIKRALQQGLEWTVISSHVGQMWPKFVDVAQSALNHKATLDISELEGCMGMHREASRLMTEKKLKEHEAWEAARREALAQEPSWGPYSKSLANFAARCTLEQLQGVRDIRGVLFKVRHQDQ